MKDVLEKETKRRVQEKGRVAQSAVILSVPKTEVLDSVLQKFQTTILRRSRILQVRVQTSVC